MSFAIRNLNHAAGLNGDVSERQKGAINGRIKRGQFDRKGVGGSDRCICRSPSIGVNPTVRWLDMHKTQGIEHLIATGMSKRKIARTLGIDRKSVDRHLADIQS